MKVEEIEIAKIRFLPYNPNRLGAAGIAALEESHREFSTLQNVVVNDRRGPKWPEKERGLYVVAGEHRLRAARALKLRTYPAVRVKLTPEREKLANLALNLRGDFDLRKLGRMLEEIRAAEVDLLASGFKEQADAIIEKLKRELEAPSEFPEIERINAPHRCPKCGYEWKGSCRP